MAISSPIKNTVFDLGAVLLHWSPEEIARQFAESEQQQQLLLDQVFHHHDWVRLDLGEISEQQALACFAENTQLPLEKMQELMICIKEFLIPKTGTVELLMELKSKGHRVFCLSNICTEIYQFCAQRYDVFEQFEDVIVSAEVKLAKPDPAVFAYMLQRFDLLPEQTLFLDDRSDNIDAAANMGIHAVQFTEIGECRRAIQKIIG